MCSHESGMAAGGYRYGETLLALRLGAITLNSITCPAICLHGCGRLQAGVKTPTSSVCGLAAAETALGPKKGALLKYSVLPVTGSVTDSLHRLGPQGTSVLEARS